MKKILILCLILALLLTACANDGQTDSVVSVSESNISSDLQSDIQSSDSVENSEFTDSFEDTTSNDFSSVNSEIIYDDSQFTDSSEDITTDDFSSVDSNISYDDSQFTDSSEDITTDIIENETTSESAGQLSVTTTVTKAEIVEILPGEDTADLLNPEIVKKAGANKEALAMRRKILNAKDKLSVKGTTYYVSSKGDDSNDGKSPKTPFATLNNAFTMAQDGDAVLLERGSVFRLVNTVTLENGVTYGAYGKGNKPEVWGSLENYAKETRWQPYNIRNVWEIDFVGSDVGIIVFNHGELAGNMEYYVRNLNKNGDYCFDDVAKKLYVYCDKGNPGKVYDDIEIGSSKVLFRLRNGAQNVTIDNISLKYTGTFGIHGSVGCKNIKITNCVVGWIGGSLFTDGSNRYGNGIEFTAGCENLTVEDCWIYQIYDAGFTFQITRTDSKEECTYRNIRVKNNLIEYSSWAFEWWPSEAECEIDDVLVTNNIMRFSGYGWADDTRQPSHLRGSWSAKDFKITNFKITKNIFDCANGPIYAWTLYDNNQMGDSLSANKYYQTKPTSDRNYLFTFVHMEQDADLYNASNQKELSNLIKLFDPKATLIKWIK